MAKFARPVTLGLVVLALIGAGGSALLGDWSGAGMFATLLTVSVLLLFLQPALPAEEAAAAVSEWPVDRVRTLLAAAPAARAGHIAAVKTLRDADPRLRLLDADRLVREAQAPHTEPAA